MTMCHMPWIVFLSHPCGVRVSVVGLPSREANCFEILGVTGMQSLWSVLWSTGKSITFCPSEESPLTKTHSSTKAFLNESPTGIQSIDKPNLTSGTQQQRQHQKRNDPMVDWLESKHVRARNKHDTTNQCSSMFVESLSTMVGGTLNAS